MSKIEDLAFKEYPVVMTTLIPADDEHPLIEQDCNKFIREAYIKGYFQAEKDLELSWEDIETIQEMANKYCKYHSCEPRFFVYSEVLKRFNDFKERKEL